MPQISSGFQYVAKLMVWTYIAANQPVSLSSALKRPDNVRSISSEWMLFSNRVWPSELVARQLRAKQAFLLAPVSSQLNIFAREEICQRRNESAYALTIHFMNIHAKLHPLWIIILIIFNVCTCIEQRNYLSGPLM